MSVNRIVKTKRGWASALAAAAFAAATGWATLFGGSAPDTPQEVRAAVSKGYVPPAVRLSINKLIKPWEGVRLEAYLDSVGVPTICWGETEGVRLGMKKTLAECDAMLERRVLNDYYLPLVDKGRNFLNAPDSVQASMTGLKSALLTPSSSSVGEASTRSNRRGKLSHRLKQRRQPWQMSNTRRSSASSFASS